MFNWTRWLIQQNNDTISAASFTVNPTGLTINSPISSFTATTATVWISGGTLGACYDVYCTITTAAGLIRTKVIKVTIKNEVP
jgi:hypothetical protein